MPQSYRLTCFTALVSVNHYFPIEYDGRLLASNKGAFNITKPKTLN